ncbi:MAG: hypothetical protein AAF580_16015, partial [Pseudomonadota bacterium]
MAALVAGCSDDNANCETNPIECDDAFASGGGGTGAGTPTTTSTANGGAGGTGGQGGAGGNPTCSTDPDVCDDPALPACSDDGVCVECTPDDAALCDPASAQPACNPATLACDLCRYHSDCPASACNIFSGECINATPITVGPDAGDDHATLQAALAEVMTGSEGVILLKPKGSPYNEATAINIVGNRTIAILAQGEDVTWNEDDGSSTLTVAAGTTVFIEGIAISGNTAAVAAITANGQLALDKVEVRQNAGEGITAGSAAELRIRNSIIAANANNTAAIALGGADLQLLFSAVANANTSSMAS